MEGLAATSGRRRRDQVADHVRPFGRAAVGRVGGRVAAGLRERRSGEGGKRRSRPVPARRVRRGHVGVSDVVFRDRHAQQGAMEPAAGADRFRRAVVEPARRRHLGGTWATPALHALQDDGLGGGRSGSAHDGAVAGRGTLGPVAGPSRRDPRRRVGQGLQRAQAGVHAVLRLRRPGCQHPHDAVGRVSPGDGSPDGQHDRGHRARAHRRRFRPALRHQGRRHGGRALRPRGRLFGVLLLARRLPPHDRSGRRRTGALRASHRTLQRCRTPVRGVRPRDGTPGRQLPPGLLPRVAGQYRLPPLGQHRPGAGYPRTRGPRPPDPRLSGRAGRRGRRDPAGRTLSPGLGRCPEVAQRELGRSRRCPTPPGARYRHWPKRCRAPMATTLAGRSEGREREAQEPKAQKPRAQEPQAPAQEPKRKEHP